MRDGHECIRAGKCLPVTATDVAVTLERPPLRKLAEGANNRVRWHNPL
jgi:hypothetical protein